MEGEHGVEPHTMRGGGAAAAGGGGALRKANPLLCTPYSRLSAADVGVLSPSGPPIGSWAPLALAHLYFAGRPAATHMCVALEKSIPKSAPTCAASRAPGRGRLEEERSAARPVRPQTFRICLKGRVRGERSPLGATWRGRVRVLGHAGSPQRMQLPNCWQSDPPDMLVLWYVRGRGYRGSARAQRGRTSQRA